MNIYIACELNNLEKKLDTPGLTLTINSNLRHRNEEGFYLVNVQWGNSISVRNEIAEFTKNKKGQALNISEIPFNKSTIVFLILKNILQNKDIDIGKELKSQGLSFNFETLPYFESVNELKNWK